MKYFSVLGASSLSELRPHARIHVIGVAGVAMAQMAVELSNRGYVVSGSDKEFYEPMKSVLERSSIRLYRQYAEDNITNDIDLVVVGNVVSYGHPEVVAVEKRKLRYSLFPKILYELLIDSHHSIVVTGTHGKSTTTAMGATVLSRLQQDPSYFIGGVVRDLPESLHSGAGRFSVVEGDEYDSAFFAKVPKFSFYQPNTAIVTSIEYDHADIYPDLESIEAQFNQMIETRKERDTAIVCIDFPVIRRLISRWREKAVCALITYGDAEEADIRLLDEKSKDGVVQYTVQERGGPTREFALRCSGRYNGKNALAMLIALQRNGITWEDAAAQMREFLGVRRRQEVRFETPEIVLIEDFAHHPTAVRETLSGIAKRYPHRRMWAIFEPRSNTSRRKVFQNDYVEAFLPAQIVFLCQVGQRAIDSASDLLDVATLADQIATRVPRAECLPSPAAIGERIVSEAQSGDVVVVMSNGSFGGLIDSLINELRGKFAP